MIATVIIVIITLTCVAVPIRAAIPDDQGRIASHRWRVLSLANATQFAWDVEYVQFIDDSGDDITSKGKLISVKCSGSASDQEFGGYEGYEVSNAMRPGADLFWGGRNDRLSRRWIEVVVNEAIVVKEVRFSQKSGHNSSSLLVQYEDQEMGLWRTARAITDLTSDRTHIIPIYPDHSLVNYEKMITITPSDTSSFSGWTWTIPTDVFVTLDTLASRCHVDPNFSFANIGEYVLMICPAENQDFTMCIAYGPVHIADNQIYQVRSIALP